MFFMGIPLRRTFDRTNGKTKVREKHFIEWIVKKGALVND